MKNRKKWLAVFLLVCMTLSGSLAGLSGFAGASMAYGETAEDYGETGMIYGGGLVTGFPDCDLTDLSLQVDYDNRPSEESLKALMPASLEVYLDGGSEPVAIPVSWYCVSGDYADTDMHFAQFSPVWDQEIYPLAEGLNVETDAPFVAVFLGEAKGDSDSFGVSTLSNSDHVDDNANMRACYKWLKNNTDFNRAKICGILANIQIECNFNPEDVNGDSYGLIQWTGKRKENLKTYCKEHGLDYTSIDGQLTYMYHELVELDEPGSSGYGYFQDAFTNDIENHELGARYCAYLFAHCYERCAVKHYLERQNLSHYFWEYFTKPAYVTDANLKVSGVSFPDSVGTGDSYSFSGKVSADYDITKIKAGVAYYEEYKNNSSEEAKTSVGKWIKSVSVNPDSTSYNLSKISKKLDFSSLTSGKKYTFFMTAYVKSVGRTVLFQNFTVKKGQVMEAGNGSVDVTAPSAPANLKASLKADGIKLSWGSVDGAEEYIVYRKSGSGSYKKLGTVNSSAKNYTDKTAQAGTKYTYGVTASSDQWETKKRTITLPFIPSLKPTLTNKEGGVQIAWTSVSNVTGYQVYRKLGDGDYKLLTSCGSGTKAYTDASVNGGKTYTYSVVGYYEGSSTTYTSVKSGVKIVRLDTLTPSLSNTSEGIRISWKAVEGAKEYAIYRAAEGGSLTVLEKLSAEDGLSYVDTQVKRDNGALYFYAVRAVNGSYSGGYYKKGQYRVTEVEMSGLVNVSDLSMEVRWFKNKNCNGYQVQIATNSGMSKNKKSYNVSGKDVEVKKIGKLTKGSKYYVRVRAYIKEGDQTYYSAWCKKGTVVIKK